MYKDRKLFQANLRKDIDIKKHIASKFYEQLVKRLNEEVNGFTKKVAEEALENEK